MGLTFRREAGSCPMTLREDSSREWNSHRAGRGWRHRRAIAGAAMRVAGGAPAPTAGGGQRCEAGRRATANPETLIAGSAGTSAPQPAGIGGATPEGGRKSRRYAHRRRRRHNCTGSPQRWAARGWRKGGYGASNPRCRRHRHSRTGGRQGAVVRGGREGYRRAGNVSGPAAPALPAPAFHGGRRRKAGGTRKWRRQCASATVSAQLHSRSARLRNARPGGRRPPARQCARGSAPRHEPHSDDSACRTA